MSILKHKSSKNMNYGDSIDYLKYKHKEDSVTGHYEPILDEDGRMQERENYALCYINGYGQEDEPDAWAAACMITNIQWGGNNTAKERKQHQYIISHPESDTPLLTKEALLEEGKAFVRENLKGYDAIIAVHMDTDHSHIHIVINSIRSVARGEEPWMLHGEDGTIMHCETAAGKKHQDSPTFRRHCQKWLLEYSRMHGWTVENNLMVEDSRKVDRRLSLHKQTVETILAAASKSVSIQDLQRKLKEQNQIELNLRGKTFTLFLPDRKKGIRLESLGLSKADLLKAMNFSSEIIAEAEMESTITTEQKRYISWIRERRLKNAVRSEDTLADAAERIARHVRTAGLPYNKWDFKELDALVKQTVYLERDLNIELEKIDRLLNRWKLYQDVSLPDSERTQHLGFVQWCGCNPDSQEEFQSLQSTRDIVCQQIKEAISVREALIDSSDQWQFENQKMQFRFHPEWTVSKEEQLRQELSSIRANRRKLEQIAYNCQIAADHRIPNQELAKKAIYYRKLWHKKLEEEKAIQQKIRQAKKGISKSELLR